MIWMKVALHPEGVDRNKWSNTKIITPTRVALHPEGVDRNFMIVLQKYRISVALHPEGVDRNRV